MAIHGRARRGHDELGEADAVASALAACQAQPPRVLQRVAREIAERVAGLEVPVTAETNDGEELCRDLPFSVVATAAEICEALAVVSGVEAGDLRLFCRGTALRDKDQPLLLADDTAWACRERAVGLLVDQVPRAIQRSDGSTYCGCLRGGLFNGSGTMWYASGDRYEGRWENGMRSGEGKYTYANGDVYRGHCSADMRCGHGVLHLASGDVYEGEFGADMPHGEGRMRRASGEVYQGQFVDGLRHGTGSLEQADGLIHQGSFAGGLPHGPGDRTLPDGSRYQGAFCRGKFEGEGEMRYADGHVYRGSWRGGAMDGAGEYRSPGGSTAYRGQFAADRQHGLGVYTSQSGTFEGQFADDFFHGRGVLRHADGHVEDGQFVDGCFVQQHPGVAVAALGG